MIAQKNNFLIVLWYVILSVHSIHTSDVQQDKYNTQLLSAATMVEGNVHFSLSPTETTTQKNPANPSTILAADIKSCESHPPACVELCEQTQKRSLENTNLFENASQDEQTYTVVKQLLDQFKRPFTMIELDAQHSNGLYSLTAAAHYPDAAFILVDTSQHTLPSPLRERCLEYDIYRNVTLLNTPLPYIDLAHMSECEHVDVTLVLHSADWLKSEWQRVIETLSQLSTHVIVSIPLDKQYAMIHQYLSTKKALLLHTLYNAAKSPIAALYHIWGNGSHALTRKTWLKKKIPAGSHRVVSSFTEKKLVKKTRKGKRVTTPWQPGINIITFKMCNGVYPTTTQLKEEITQLKRVPHTDWTISNMIVQGSKVKLIDYDDPYFGTLKPHKDYAKKRFSQVIKLIAIKHPDDVARYFCHTYIKKKKRKRTIR